MKHLSLLFRLVQFIFLTNARRTDGDNIRRQTRRTALEDPQKSCPKVVKGVKCVWDDFGRASEATRPLLSKPRALSSQGSLGLPPGITNSIM